MGNLSGKTIVIAGGAGLLGSEFSRACAEAGAAVIIADIDSERGARVAEELSSLYPTASVFFEKADIRDEASMKRLAKIVVEKHGVIHGAVNAAYPKSEQFGKSFADAALEDMLTDLNLHVGGCLTLCKAFLPHMQEKRSGSIIFVASIYGIVAPKFDLYEGTSMTLPAEYAAAKGATIMLARYFASLAGKENVRVNAISPGGIAAGQPDSFVEKYSRHLAIGSALLKPQDVSGALLFLLSDASAQITGQNLVVDGGWTL